MLFHPLVSKIWARTDQNGTQIELVVEHDRPNQKEAILSVSMQFCHMPERYKRVLVGWHCAKVKCRVELKIGKNRVKTFSYDFPKLHHSNPSSFGADVHLRPIKNTVYVIERLRDVTPRSKYEQSKGHPRLCSKYGAILSIIFGVMAFWENE